MKKVLVVLSVLVALVFSSCTKNARAKKWGGEMTIEVPKGMKVTNITWKEAQLWYSYRPFENGETPSVQIFKEESSWGVMEGTVTFKESN